MPQNNLRGERFDLVYAYLQRVPPRSDVLHPRLKAAGQPTKPVYLPVASGDARNTRSR